MFDHGEMIVVVVFKLSLKSWLMMVDDVGIRGY